MPQARKFTRNTLVVALIDITYQELLERKEIPSPMRARYASTISRIIHRKNISQDWEDLIRTTLLDLPATKRPNRTSLHFSVDVAAAFREARDMTGVSNDEMMLTLLGILDQGIIMMQNETRRQ